MLDDKAQWFLWLSLIANVFGIASFILLIFTNSAVTVLKTNVALRVQLPSIISRLRERSASLNSCINDFGNRAGEAQAFAEQIRSDLLTAESILPKSKRQTLDSSLQCFNRVLGTSSRFLGVQRSTAGTKNRKDFQDGHAALQGAIQTLDSVIESSPWR
jgi:hypothetical protein